MKLPQEDLLCTFNNVQSYHRPQDVQFFSRPAIPSSAATPQSSFGNSGQDVNHPIDVELRTRRSHCVEALLPFRVLRLLHVGRGHHVLLGVISPTPVCLATLVGVASWSHSSRSMAGVFVWSPPLSLPCQVHRHGQPNAPEVPHREVHEPPVGRMYLFLLPVEGTEEPKPSSASPVFTHEPDSRSSALQGAAPLPPSQIAAPGGAMMSGRSFTVMDDDSLNKFRTARCMHLRSPGGCPFYFEGKCKFSHDTDVRRRPLLHLDLHRPVMKYCNYPCPEVEQHRPCSEGSRCPFAHTQAEIDYHPCSYKTKPCSAGVRCTTPAEPALQAGADLPEHLVPVRRSLGCIMLDNTVRAAPGAAATAIPPPPPGDPPSLDQTAPNSVPSGAANADTAAADREWARFIPTGARLSPISPAAATLTPPSTTDVGGARLEQQQQQQQRAEQGDSSSSSGSAEHFETTDDTDFFECEDALVGTLRALKVLLQKCHTLANEASCLAASSSLPGRRQFTEEINAVTASLSCAQKGLAAAADSVGAARQHRRGLGGQVGRCSCRCCLGYSVVLVIILVLVGFGIFTVMEDATLQQFRTEWCMHLRSPGGCPFQGKCKFAHAADALRRRPLLHLDLHRPVMKYCPVPCPELDEERRSCKRGESCPFAHTQAEVLYHPFVYKTKPCSAGVRCTTSHCPFFHSMADKRSGREGRLSEARLPLRIGLRPAEP
ncbi:unnamed protein product [Vitrella brassicaformis CCMP3155]|uniref:C3H1-type domain-containing protein n=1 Tax=Vitrella brassicaformis (strain CCMP3155) TaxID=1169540 RepID=A0A0G4GEC7_VITBC|nr:unnamed protein product [Vitrella brassicaformis CCMP3155]|eukprot:CEM27745.1 unnamed protein product [Vitrella brassicaformis CCMP3155]